MLAPPSHPTKGWRPDLEEILDPPLLFQKLAETLPVGVLYCLFSKLAYGERDANSIVCQFSRNREKIDPLGRGRGGAEGGTGDRGQSASDLVVMFVLFLSIGTQSIYHMQTDIYLSIPEQTS